MLRLRALPTLLVAALMTSAGCGQDPYAAVLNERVQAQVETLKILKTVQDETTMTLARAQLVHSYQRYEEIARKVQSVRRSPGEARQQLEADFAKRMQQVLTQTQEELLRIKNLPRGEEFIAGLEQLKQAP
jgi:glycyl-tRNA synthetase beta subunit